MNGCCYEYLCDLKTTSSSTLPVGLHLLVDYGSRWPPGGFRLVFLEVQTLERLITSLKPDWICSQEQTSKPRRKLTWAVEADEEGRKAGYREARFLGLFMHPEGFGHFLWDYFSYLLLVMI